MAVKTEPSGPLLKCDLRKPTEPSRARARTALSGKNLSTSVCVYEQRARVLTGISRRTWVGLILESVCSNLVPESIQPAVPRRRSHKLAYIHAHAIKPYSVLPTTVPHPGGFFGGIKNS